MSVYVKNLHGTSILQPTCKCFSWLEHWEVNKKTNAGAVCMSCGKYVGHSNLVGGHVIKWNSCDNKHYIVPICRECNADPYNVFSTDEDNLVSANCSYCINQ